MKIQIFFTSLMLVISFSAHGSPDQPSEGFDALSMDGSKNTITYHCMDNPGGTVPAPKFCTDEYKAISEIQCRADWASKQQTIDFYQCGAEHSTGDFKAHYQMKADGYRKFKKEHE